MILLSLLVFFLLFSFLILIHEAGHFIAARKSGVKVLEFGLGLGPKIYGKQVGETEYTFNAVPFGGFVRMLGEEESSDDPRSFEQAKLWKRMVITLAGIFVNWVFAILGLMILFMVGTKPLLLDTDQASVQWAAERGWVTMGAEMSDEMVTKYTAIATDFGITAEEFSMFMEDPESSAAQKKIQNTYAEIDWDNKTETQKDAWNGMIGVMYSDAYPEMKTNIIKLPIEKALPLAASESVRVAKEIVKKASSIPGELIRTRQVPEGLSGPVGIAEITHKVTPMGFWAIFKLTVMLSLSLAVMNLLPLPALDGGRFLFQIIELITQKAVPQKYENMLHIAGFIFLMGLLVVITINDIAGLIGRIIA